MDGVGKHVSDLVRYLDKTKYKIVVVHGTDRVDYYFREMMKDMKAEVTFCPIPSMKRNIHPGHDLVAYMKINRLIRSYKPKVIHCHSSKAGVLGRIASLDKSYVKKVIYTPHAYAIQNLDLNSYRHLLFLRIERWLGHRHKMITANVSYGEQKFALEQGIVSDSKVIYNAISDKPMIDDEKRFKLRESLGIGIDDIFVICVARLYHQKSPNTFVEIANKVLESSQNVHFIWVGEGEMLAAMRKKNNAQNIAFIGHRRDVHELLCSADIFLSTALYEGLPYTLIEACRAGLPIYATNITGNNEVVVDQVNGMLFEGLDTSGLQILIESEEERITEGSRAREIYENRFGIEHMIKEIESLYSS